MGALSTCSMYIRCMYFQAPPCVLYIRTVHPCSRYFAGLNPDVLWTVIRIPSLNISCVKVDKTQCHGQQVTEEVPPSRTTKRKVPSVE